jgi:RNA polymerase sigma-70 factor (ECF subfamily)
LCRGQFDAADLVQDVLLRTLSHHDRLPEGVNHRAWMAQVMKNLFIDQVRRRNPVRADVDPSAVPATIPDEPAWWQSLDAEHVRAALAELPDDQREVFDRFAFRGESYQQIADALGIPKATVGTRILRARRRLKELLEKRARTTT